MVIQRHLYFYSLQKFDLVDICSFLYSSFNSFFAFSIFFKRYFNTKGILLMLLALVQLFTLGPSMKIFVLI